jgi:hypothetical protein
MALCVGWPIYGAAAQTQSAAEAQYPSPSSPPADDAAPPVGGAPPPADDAAPPVGGAPPPADGAAPPVGGAPPPAGADETPSRGADDAGGPIVSGDKAGPPPPAAGGAEEVRPRKLPPWNGDVLTLHKWAGDVLKNSPPVVKAFIVLVSWGYDPPLGYGALYLNFGGR